MTPSTSEDDDSVETTLTSPPTRRTDSPLWNMNLGETDQDLMDFTDPLKFFQQGSADSPFVDQTSTQGLAEAEAEAEASFDASAVAALGGPLASVDALAVVQCPALAGPPGSVDAPAEPVEGSKIETLFPNDMHFICGCSNFEPIGHNDILRVAAIEYVQNELKNGRKCKFAESVMKFLTFVSQKAREGMGTPASKFRIWSAVDLKPKEQLNQSSWRKHLFKEITSEPKELKAKLRPLRKAIDDAKEGNGNLEGAMAAPEGSLVQTTGVSDAVIRAPSALPSELGGSGSLVQTTGVSDTEIMALSTSTSELGVSGPSILVTVRIAETIYSRANPDMPRSQRARVEPTPAEQVLKEMVDRYCSPEIEWALARLESDRGIQPVDNWARELYEKFRDEPDERCIILNNDRRTCLTLIYDLVKEWEKHGFSAEFAQSIVLTFQERRLERILELCLPMDRAQAMYKLKNLTAEAYGIPWYSELHLSEVGGFESEEEKGEWMEYLKSQPQHEAPMNKRLFRLLNNPHFRFREKDHFKRWGKPARVPAREQAPN